MKKLTQKKWKLTSVFTDHFFHYLILFFLLLLFLLLLFSFCFRRGKSPWLMSNECISKHLILILYQGGLFFIFIVMLVVKIFMFLIKFIIEPFSFPRRKLRWQFWHLKATQTKIIMLITFWIIFNFTRHCSAPNFYAVNFWTQLNFQLCGTENNF